MRVYIGCFGSGLGHASRMLEVANELVDKGAEVQFSSSGEVTRLIRAHDFDCNDLPLADVKYSDSGKFLIDETLLSSPSILAATGKQVGHELSNIQRFGAAVVLSDSALSTVISGRILRLPTYVVLNQLNLTSSHTIRGTMSRVLSLGTSAGMAKLWELGDEVLLPDLPPPYTISERNLWGSGVGKLRYVGFLASTGQGRPDLAAKEFATDPRPKVFWQVSGPPQTRGVFLRAALSCADRLSKDFALVISGGDPLSQISPSRVPGGWYYGWCERPDFFFDACDLVVARAGQVTIGQAICAGKPSLLVPIPQQPEQEGNAAKAAKLGVSLVLPQERLGVDSVEGSLHKLLGGGYQSAAQSLGQFARTFDAKKEIVQTLFAASGRAPRPVLSTAPSPSPPSSRPRGSRAL
jgi:UDP-N-acetylglucosamine--N-acetylmuramyl-(pentapeptide) pyrophosphoryl-undecaprenol N-acetylglucosamine transferase